jgi:CsoR family transcriptional regulator, copper-sensing transcriptional repressor
LATDTNTTPARPGRAGGPDAHPCGPGPGPGAEDGTFRHSYARDRQLLLRRLARVEGQVRGIARMIERDEYCIDILQQTAALRAAVDAVAILVLEDHIAGCLRTAAETGQAQEYTEEVMDVVRRTLGRPVRGPKATIDQEPVRAARS